MSMPKFWPSCIWRGLTVALLGTLCACSPGGDLPAMSPYDASAYRLGGGDRVRIVTFGQEQLSGEFTVSDQGEIAVPLLGTVQAGQITPEQLSQEIAKGFRDRNILHDASVAVQILAYRPIFVLGEVNKPGQYPYQPGMTMLTAVAVAGGFTYRAVTDYASDVRTTHGSVERGKIVRESLVAPGDVVDVFERHF